MCVVCGCNTDSPSEHSHVREPAGDMHRAALAPADLHYGSGAAGFSLPGMSQTRTLHLEADVLAENKRLANRNRAHFAAHGVTALNLVSSPGSGKTTLLCASIHALKQRIPALQVAVIEGDQQTSVDADRIRASGAPAIQVNTGRGCHLDALMVSDAFARLDLHAAAHHSHGSHADQAILFIENVGNLVCPALWDLGEAAKVVVLSVTEGDDKPLKYPDIFAAATIMLINKIDLLPYVNFDVARCIQYARQINPSIKIIEVSATHGDGMDKWLNWFLSQNRDHADQGGIPVHVHSNPPNSVEAEAGQIG